jgi:hypothetical protein
VLLFSVLSVASLLFFRNPIMRRLNLEGGAADLDTLAGQTCSVLEPMPPAATAASSCAAQHGARAIWHDTALERRTVHRDTVRAADATGEGRGGPFMIGMGSLLVFVALAILVLIIVAKTAVVVPQQNAYVVERLGRYSGTLGAGFHVLMPFMDVIRYRHSLKEAAYDIPAQVCITRDNVQVGVDGILYLKVLNAERASYGISDYLFAITQLAQTTLRSEIGKIDLDKTFEERTNINMSVVAELDKASEPWGVKCCATRSRTSRRRMTFWPRWKSRCAPSARSAR